MPGLPRTYKEIEEMVRSRVLGTEMARKIVRKAGFRVEAISETGGTRSAATPILDIPGAKAAGPGDCPPDDPDCVECPPEDPECVGSPVPNPPFPGTPKACSDELQNLIADFNEEHNG